MVVTKGAERVSEVGARFVLDAMPGRQMAIERIPEPLVGGKVAGEAGQAGQSGQLIEECAEMFRHLAAAGAVGRQTADGEAPADRLDERGGHVGVVGFIASEHLHAVTVRNHNPGHVVPEVDQLDELPECRRCHRQHEAATEEVAGAEDAVARPQVSLVAVRRGDDRPHQQRPIDAPPGEADRVAAIHAAMHPQVAEGAELACHGRDRAASGLGPVFFREPWQGNDVLGGEEVIERAARRVRRGE